MKNPKTSNDFEIIFRGNYIHVILGENFEITPGVIEKIWTATAEACRRYDCHRVLSKGNIRARKLNAWDAYTSGSKAGEIQGLRQACLFYNYQTDDVTEFFKSVSANRGIEIEFFKNKDEALKWLGIDDAG